MHPTSHSELAVEETLVMIVPAMFVIMFAIFLLNLLFAQLKGAYQAAYEDMVGHARLNRAEIIVTTMEQVLRSKCTRGFTASQGDGAGCTPALP